MQHECAVLVVQHLREKSFTGTLFLIEHGPLAQTGVDEQPQGEWQVCVAGEIVKSYWVPIFLQHEVARAEIRNNLAVLIPHCGENIYDLYVSRKGGGCRFIGYIVGFRGSFLSETDCGP